MSTKKIKKGKSGKAGKALEKAEKNKKENGVIPPLLEFAFSFSKLMILLVGLLITTLSLSSGVTPLLIAFRAVTGMFVVGIVLYLLTWLLSNGSLEAVKAKQEKEKEEMAKAQEASHTMEFQA